MKVVIMRAVAMRVRSCRMSENTKIIKANADKPGKFMGRKQVMQRLGNPQLCSLKAILAKLIQISKI